MSDGDRADELQRRRLALGRQLFRRRRGRGKSQVVLAAALLCDRSTLSRAENGAIPDDRRFWERLDTALAARGTLLAGFDALIRFQDGLDDTPLPLVPAELAVNRVSRLTAVTEAAPLPTRVERVLPGLDVDQVLPGSRTTEIAAIRSMSAAFQAADRRIGGGALYAQVHRYLRVEVAPLLLDPDSGSGAAVFSAAASLTECAGWMAHDTGHDQLARRHFDRAFRLASAAADAPLTAMTCASMSHLAGQLGHGQDAVRLAEVGLARARPAPGTTALLARLHAMKARGKAILGDRGACLTALDKAEQILRDHPDEVPAHWIPRFDEGALAAETALCLWRVGDLVQAERQARRAIELRPADRVRARAFAHLILATVLKDNGRIAEAANAGRAVSAVAPSLSSARVQTRLDRLGIELSAHRSTPEVELFLDDLTAVRIGSDGNNFDTASWPV